MPACAVAQPQPDLLAWPFALPELPGNTAIRPLGGIEIDRVALGFGGISGVHIAPDLTVTVVSDLSHWAEFALSLDAAARPLRLTLRRTGRLRDGGGRILPRGYAGDAEALARLPDGDWLVTFERWHRIRRYRDIGGPGAYVEPPPGLERAPANAGLESLAVLADGRWFAIAEDLALPEAPGLTAAWLGGPGAWLPVAWRPAPGFFPVDAAPLPDGGALVLERSFSWLAGFSGRLTRIGVAALAAARPGTVLEGEELLRIASPLPVDNYEGVTTVLHQGRQLVALVSDDNENRLQRSLLLLFELTR
ncbi:esterase-like activity of phytase family protein [Falsiroseomonas oryzae]|uniref:esterase-like activity of phytase family protein n=1 Tax=Falsiroseomonas oryzae TaxID=2766473 RepID=UPI0022EA9689|nr:esterase-like activity of phytase family protein [Roseomonas sp. MO-31]